jgi:hypothetical protein
MGVHPNIGFLRFPKQGDWVGQRVRVLFDYDTTMQIEGTIVRDDAEEPGRTIIQLDDGRFVLTTECQHSLPFAPPRPPTP